MTLRFAFMGPWRWYQGVAIICLSNNVESSSIAGTSLTAPTKACLVAHIIPAPSAGPPHPHAPDERSYILYLQCLDTLTCTWTSSETGKDSKSTLLDCKEGVKIDVPGPGILELWPSKPRAFILAYVGIQMCPWLQINRPASLERLMRPPENQQQQLVPLIIRGKIRHASDIQWALWYVWYVIQQRAFHFLSDSTPYLHIDAEDVEPGCWTGEEIPPPQLTLPCPWAIRHKYKYDRGLIFYNDQVDDLTTFRKGALSQTDFANANRAFVEYLATSPSSLLVAPQPRIQEPYQNEVLKRFKHIAFFIAGSPLMDPQLSAFCDLSLLTIRPTQRVKEAIKKSLSEITRTEVWTISSSSCQSSTSSASFIVPDFKVSNINLKPLLQTSSKDIHIIIYCPEPTIHLERVLTALCAGKGGPDFLNMWMETDLSKAVPSWRESTQDSRFDQNLLAYIHLNRPSNNK